MAADSKPMDIEEEVEEIEDEIKKDPNEIDKNLKDTKRKLGRIGRNLITAPDVYPSEIKHVKDKKPVDRLAGKIVEDAKRQSHRENEAMYKSYNSEKLIEISNKIESAGADTTVHFRRPKPSTPPSKMIQAGGRKPTSGSLGSKVQHPVSVRSTNRILGTSVGGVEERGETIGRGGTSATGLIGERTELKPTSPSIEGDVGGTGITGETRKLPPKTYGVNTQGLPAGRVASPSRTPPKGRPHKTPSTGKQPIESPKPEKNKVPPYKKPSGKHPTQGGGAYGSPTYVERNYLTPKVKGQTFIYKDGFGAGDSRTENVVPNNVVDESETYIGNRDKEEVDMNKINHTKVGDDIHFYVNGKEDRGVVVKMSNTYLTVFKEDGMFHEIHINDTFFVKDIVVNKTWDNMTDAERVSALEKAHAPSPRFVKKDWYNLPPELRSVLSKEGFTYEAGTSKEDEGVGHRNRDNSLAANNPTTNDNQSGAFTKGADDEMGSEAGGEEPDLRQNWSKKKPKIGQKKSNVEEGTYGSAGRNPNAGVNTNTDFDAEEDYEGQTHEKDSDVEEEFKHERKKPATKTRQVGIPSANINTWGINYTQKEEKE